MSSKKRYLMVYMSPFFGVKEILPVALLVQSNRDIYKGVFIPKEPKSIDECYAIFESDDEERINNLAETFRLILEKMDYTAKYLVRVRKRLNYDDFKCLGQFF